MQEDKSKGKCSSCVKDPKEWAPANRADNVTRRRSILLGVRVRVTSRGERG